MKKHTHLIIGPHSSPWENYAPVREGRTPRTDPTGRSNPLVPPKPRFRDHIMECLGGILLGCMLAAMFFVGVGL